MKMTGLAIPAEIKSARVILRRWRESDAECLLPILIRNTQHLRGWIPDRVAEPAPIPDLQARLGEFAALFEKGREWRFAIVSQHENDLIGEASLFVRNVVGRVGLEDGDRFEIGYWLDARVTGSGFASEATGALLVLIRKWDPTVRVEIRCDPRNHRSAAIPQRLGFKLDASASADDLMVWYCGDAGRKVSV